MKLVQGRNYRNDIDGLRAIAVLAVIIFHFGYLPNGFLGVDVFFVISGFLITGIIYKEINDNRFSIINFYLRRIRRIIPLALFISLVALAVGICIMLPDDLENLAQSVIATNFFSNNILQAITTKNYWDVVNEYKPLIHTWSLGIEEQYYLLYPFLFILIGKKYLAWLLPIISTFIVVSLMLYLLPYHPESQKFYLIYFRFWELAVGGIAAITLKNKLINHKYSTLFILFLIAMICFDFSFIKSKLTLLIVVLLTVGVLSSSNERNNLTSLILENKLLVTIGKISFSMYMWHQLLLAYTRYFIIKELHLSHLIAIFSIVIILSVISYLLIEQPFRNKEKINTRRLLLILGFVFFLTNASSFYIYLNAGVLKDIPELGIRKSEVERNFHAKYNSRIYKYDKEFRSTDTIKVLVIGNSFARDWANVLMESKYAKDIEISYIYGPHDQLQKVKDRAKQADVIFYSTPKLYDVQEIGIQETKLWAVGTKNFGTSNGIFYNYKGDGYHKQRSLMENGYLEKNQLMLQEWGDRYIDYIGKVIDDNKTVPVFTPSHQFISQDCRHFTKAGAQYYAQLFEHDLTSIFSKVKK
ncbi:MAG: acyltransferase [Bacteroidales bacterium]|nr:acyltransferase [Bacteroidales bacterium]